MPEDISIKPLEGKSTDVLNKPSDDKPTVVLNKPSKVSAQDLFDLPNDPILPGQPTDDGFSHDPGQSSALGSEAQLGPASSPDQLDHKDNDADSQIFHDALPQVDMPQANPLGDVAQEEANFEPIILKNKKLIRQVPPEKG